MSLVISPAGVGAVTYVDWIADFYAHAAQYWQLYPNAHPWGFRKFTQASPLVDGRSVKRAGRDTRTVERIVVWYVNASISGCEAQYVADAEAMMNKACSLTLPGQAGDLPSAECLRCEKIPGSRGRMFLKDPVSNLFRCQVQIAFEQLRQS